MTVVTKQQPKTKLKVKAWYRPTFSPEHGVYVVLLGSFVTGVALAEAWTLSTTLALLCAFCGFQAEYPFSLQLKQRSSLKPRFLVWAGLYSVVALGLAVWLYLGSSVLLWFYGGAIAALIVDGIEIWRKQRKSILNELITFVAVCLAAPLAYAATTGEITPLALAIWVLNTLYFSSTIFLVKLRKPQTSSLIPGIVYHVIATLIVSGLYWFKCLSLFTALTFALALLKFLLITWQLQWYRNTKIENIGFGETFSALIFVAIVVFSFSLY